MFFPFTLAWRGIKYVVARIKIPITAKSALIYALLFTLALVLIDIFIVSSVQSYLDSIGVPSGEYMLKLRLTSAALIVISIAVVASVGAWPVSICSVR